MSTDKLFTALLLALVLGSVVSQPIPRTSWQQINERPAADRSYPRIAAFSTNGEYAVVYGVANDTLNSHIAVTIFHNNGIVKVPERILSSLPGINYAPNIMVINEVAIVVWRHQTVPVISNSHFRANGEILASYTISIEGTPLNTDDFYGLFSVNNSLIYGVAISPTSSSSATAIFQSIGVAIVNSPYSPSGSVVDIPSVVYDPRNNASYWFERLSDATRVTSNRGVDGQQVNVATLPISKYQPFLIDSPLVLPTLNYDTVRGSISLQVFEQASITVVFQRDLFNTTQARYVRPEIVHLGSNYVLAAQTGAGSTLEYRYLRINEKSIDFIGPVMMGGPITSDGVSMIFAGSYIVVAAYNSNHTQVITRSFTFCGNGVVDFNEQCDGSRGCMWYCGCPLGTVPRNGLCEDRCGNSFVTGDEDCDGTEGCNPSTCKCLSGYQPSIIEQRCTPVPADFVPAVGPSLDCVVIKGDELELYFSFVSSDPFDQTIEYGAMNTFIPTHLATGRPTFFKSGTSLTYPVSPYVLYVYKSIQQFTWLLGSYNLTVDLSGDKPNALQCPKNAGFVMNIATFDTLSDADVRVILVNMAARYNISINRVDATYRLSAAGSASEPNIYSISITIQSSTDPEDPNAQDVLKSLYSDLVAAKDELASDLTQGLEEKNPQIKDVTPVPTGVEVRGQERDIEPVVFVPTVVSAAAVFTLNCVLAFVAFIFSL